MRIADVAVHALGSLLADRRQSALASIGIVCGVAAVVTSLAIGEGARREALAEVEALGVDNVVVDSPSVRLTRADAATIERTFANARVVAPVRSGSVRIESAAATLTTMATGVTETWARAMVVRVARGRLLTGDDVAAHRRVALVGADLAKRLMPGRDAVGASIRLASDWYLVVGVLAPPSPQDAILVPLDALDTRLSPTDGPDHLSRIVVTVRDQREAGAVAAGIERVLRRTLPADAVRVFVPRELVAARLRARRALDALLLAVGTLVLVTSGLGIMNVMLAGVARRVSEIGIRRAVGARRRDVVAQFAGETLALCSAGAVAGLPVGVLAATIVGHLAGWTTIVSTAVLAAGLGIALGAGVVFSIYPALVASRWTPCEALRHD
jgi:putative ABC transport system permease protein